MKASFGYIFITRHSHLPLEKKNKTLSLPLPECVVRQIRKNCHVCLFFNITLLVLGVSGPKFQDASTILTLERLHLTAPFRNMDTSKTYINL
jgi:hypothetical protein